MANLFLLKHGIDFENKVTNGSNLFGSFGDLLLIRLALRLVDIFSNGIIS